MNREIQRTESTSELATKHAGLEPTTFQQCDQLADYVAKSQLFAVKTKEAAMVVMLTGASLGLSPIAALRGVHVIQGRAVLDATLVSAIIRQHPDCEYWRIVENTNERCTIETKRRSAKHPVSRTWTMDDAKRAGLAGKDVWKAYPAAMLRSRCTTDLGRAEYGDALFGVYTAEEMERTESEPEPIQATVVVEQKPIDWHARIAACTTLDALEALRGEIKNLPEALKAALRPAYDARKAALRPQPPPNGGGTPKPEAPAHTEATGEVVEAIEAEATLAQLTAKLAGYKTPQHVANSIAAHLYELPAPLWPAAVAVGERRLRAYASVSDPTEAVFAALEHRASKVAA